MRLRLRDLVVRARMRRDLLSAWAISQGQHVLGLHAPHECFAGIARYRTADVSAKVRADALLPAGAEDHYVPIGQIADQLHLLTNAWSVTARVLTRQEQGRATVRSVTSRSQCA